MPPSALLIGICTACIGSLLRVAAPGTCVDVLQAAQHLVQEELVVLRRQVIVCLYHLRGSESPV